MFVKTQKSKKMEKWQKKNGAGSITCGGHI